ncbi:MAG: FecR domain-containing protein [Alphaproteobacteria bacterium]|nr:FecR domain-containing protein [Alphaproteobacteria bacterium]
MNVSISPVLRRGNALVRMLAFALAALLPAVALAQPAQDLPGRVGRVADLGGELFLAPQDKPDAWNAVGINWPVTSGDNLWVGNDGRAEIDFGGGQLRLAGDSNVHVSRLDDRSFALFLAQGRAAVRVRVLDPGDSVYIDTPNAQVAIPRPGLYRIDVSEDRTQTRIIVREGEANVLTQGTVQQVLPGQAASVDGADPRYATVVNGIGTDGFDAWVASRDRRYAGRSNYVSPQMVGAADLDQYGTWSQTPEYGAVWFPTEVAADWAPYRNGYWVDVGGWGPTWVDAAPWGYAPFHYGRWVWWGGRWAWAPGRFVARPIWAPALVGWAGGAGWGVAVGIGGPVYGWVPLGWGEPFRPWWGHCSFGCWERFNRPVNVNITINNFNNPPPPRWVNASRPGGMTAVSQAAFTSRQPVQANLVRMPREAVTSAPVMNSAPAVRIQPTQLSARPERAPPAASTFQTTYARPAPPAATATGVRPLQPGTDASRSRTPSTTAVQAPPRAGTYTPPASTARQAPSQPAFAPSQPSQARQVQPQQPAQAHVAPPSQGNAMRARGQETMPMPQAQRAPVQPSQSMQRAAPQPQVAQQPVQRAAPQAQPQPQPRAMPQQPSPAPQAQGSRGGDRGSGDGGGNRGRGDDQGGGGGQANRAPR